MKWCVAVLWAMLSVSSQAATLPERLELSYTVRLGPISVGTMQKTLMRDGADGHYRVTSRTEPTGVGGLVSDDLLLEEGEFRVVGDEVQPLYYRARRNGRKEFDRSVRFDWDRLELEFSDGRRLPLPPGTQDSGSLLFALMLGSYTNGTNTRLNITDGKSLREYRYSVQGVETVQTPLGILPAVRVLRRHPSKPSETRLWLGTDHHNLPLRIEQDRAGRPTTVMVLESVKGL